MAQLTLIPHEHHDSSIVLRSFPLFGSGAPISSALILDTAISLRPALPFRLWLVDQDTLQGLTVVGNI